MTAQPDVVTAEKAIASYGPGCDYNLDMIARRSGLPRELLRYGAARMDAARFEEVAAILRAENLRLRDEIKRLTAELGRMRRLKNQHRYLTTRTT